MKPIVYEGKEPYIFVSYAHRDSTAVFEVLTELQKRGYRLWYDDGIAPGSEWPEDIAQHLDAAAMVIAFVTPNSMKSQNCRREINFSLTREKPFLSIMLEPTEMPLGMEMQLSAQQSIIRHNYDSWDGFIRKVLSCPGIAPCQVPPEPEPEPAPQPQPEPEPTPFVPESTAAPAVERPASAANVGLAATAGNTATLATAETQSAELVQTGERKLAKKPNQAASEDKRAKGSPKIIGIAAAAVVVLLALFFVFGGMGGGTNTIVATTSWGEAVKSDNSYFNVSKQAVTQADLEAIAASPSLTSLKFENCDLSACDFSQVAFASEGLAKLDLSGSTGITDYSFLSSLSLKELKLSGHEAFNDLSAVNTERLKVLSINGTAVGDISALANTPIEELNISNTLINDITALGSLAELKKLVAANTGVTSVDVILPLEKLVAIDFSGCKITWSDQPIASLKLKSAKLANTGLTNLGLLSNCSLLETLDVSENSSFVDIADLDKQNYTTLKQLDLARTGVSADNLAWIGECTNLEELTLDGVPLGDLNMCASLENLKSLYAAGCSISDISGLSSCTNLQRIFLACNEIADISAFPKLAKTSNSYTVVDLSYNKLKSIASLPVGEYRAILLYGNDEEIATSMPEGIKTYEATVPWCAGVKTEMVTEPGDFTKIYLLGCPKKQQVAVQDALGSGRVSFIDEPKLLDMYKNDSFGYSLDYDATQLLSIKG